MRLHFASVGVSAARFAPLMLDFRSPQGLGRFGDDTVLWLRNGGGKSSILNLLFSVIIPSRRDFLGETADGRSQRFASYVKPHDLSFVIAEWYTGKTKQQDLIGDETQRRTWVTGQMLYWSAGGSTHDDSNLKRWFFAFRTGIGLQLESLPVQGLAAPRAENPRAFREWFEEQKRVHSASECYGTENQTDWQTTLRDTLRLDPEVFRIQLEMNRTEGGADRVMRFKTASEFAQFVFREASDPRPARELINRLEQLRARQSQRPARQLEQRFLLAIQQPLGAVEEQGRTVATLEQQLAAAESARRALALAIEERTQHTRHEQQLAQELAGKAATRARDHEQKATEREAESLWYEQEELRLNADGAQAAERAADEALSQAKIDLRAAGAARLWLKLRGTREQLEARRTARQQAQREREPQLQQLRAAALLYRGSLKLAGQQNAAQIEDVKGLLVTNREALLSTEQQQSQARAEGERVHNEMGRASERIRARDAAWQRLESDGVARSGESPSEAQRRLSEEVTTIRREQEVTVELIKDEEAAERKESTRRSDLQTRQAELRALHQRDHAAFTAAVANRDALAADQVWQSLDVDSSDLLGEAAMHALRVARDGVQAEITRLEIEGHEDRQLVDHARETGLLPPPREAEAALRWLKQHGVPVHHAGEYLASQNLDREQVAALFSTDPARFLGLVVPTAQHLERVRALMLPDTLTRPVVIALPAVEAPPSGDDRIVLPSAATGTASRADAVDVIPRAKERLAHLDRRKHELKARMERLASLLQRLTTYRDAWGGGRLDQLGRLVDAQQRELEHLTDELQRTVANLQDIASKLQVTRNKTAELQQQLTKVSQQRDRLEIFLRDHESGIEETRRHLTELEGLHATLANQAEIAARTLATLRADGELHRGRMRELEQQASALAGDLSAIPPEYLHGEPGAPMAIEIAAEPYRQLKRIYEENPSIDRLNGEIEQLEKQEHEQHDEFHKQAAGLPEQSWRHFADDPFPEAAMAGADTALRDADRRHATRIAERDRTAKALANFQRSHPQIPEPLNLQRLAAPSDYIAARQQCVDEAKAQRAHADAARRERTDAEKLGQSLRSDARQLETMAKRLVSTSQSHIGSESLPPLELPPKVEAIESLVDEVTARHQEAAAALERARRALTVRIATARRAAEAPEFVEVRDSLRSWIRVEDSELFAETSRRNIDIQSRLAALQEELNTMEVDRGLVLGDLVRLANDSRSLLARIQKVSTIPAGLHEWSGQHFIEVRLPPSTLSLEEAQERIRPLLEEVTGSKELPPPEVLCVRAVEALCGGRRLDVQIIKPHALGSVQRYPIGELGSFSDGERLTASVLLYCTLARLRARQRGHQDDQTEAGALILDNPIGKCSNQALLELQKRVAGCLGVQLVYTTGIEDLGAIATFARVIRLTNSSRSRETGDLHVRLALGENYVSAAGLSFTAKGES
jgi:hypothetical protein